MSVGRLTTCAPPPLLQTTIEQLTTDVGKTRSATERTRPRQRNHADLEKLEDDVARLTRRWTSCCEAVVDR